MTRKRSLKYGILRLVGARMDQRPRRHEQDGVLALAIDLVVDLHAVAVDEAFGVGEFCAHGGTSSSSCFAFLEPLACDRLADAAQGPAHGYAFRLEVEQQEGLGADERGADQRGDVLRREGIERAEFLLRPLRRP